MPVKTTVEISVVVLIAATMVLFSLLICLLARRSRIIDVELESGTSWLIAANTALLMAATALLFHQVLPFWLGSGIIIGGVHLGILFGYFAMHQGLGVRPYFKVFATISAGIIGLQWGFVLLSPGVSQLFASTSIINGGVTLAMGLIVWRSASSYGRELGLLVSFPFFAISAGYMLRLFLLAVGASQTVVLAVIALNAFIFAYSSLQWGFGLIALRAARLNMSLDLERQRAQDLAQIRARFLAQMSHEIRTPLNSVLGLADVLQGMLEQEDARALVGHIQHSGDLLIHILNDILDISKLEANAVKIEQRPFEVDALLRQINASHRPKCRERGLALVVDMQPEMAGYWLGDQHRVSQILHNVVGNAVKFTETGSVRVSASGVDQLRLTVEDTGIGMTKAQIAAMFDEFTQADEGITRRFGGSGLGMAIVHSLVTLMGGKIEVESRLGEGTRFIIVLPLQRADGIDDTPVPVSQPTEDFSALRVLCADDSKGNLLVLGQMLRQMGMEPQTAEDGHAAIRAAEQQTFDIYLLDISMPGISGIETLHRLREVEADQRRLPAYAVAATANVLSSDLVHYLSSGFNAHLPKPIRLDALRSVLSTCQKERRGDIDQPNGTAPKDAGGKVALL